MPQNNAHSYAALITRTALVIAIAAVTAIVMMGLTTTSAHAASTYSKSFNVDGTSKTIKKYDITGDKRADRIKIKNIGTEYNYSTAKIYVNGKRKLTLKNHLGVSGYIFRIKSGRTFLYLKTKTYNGDAMTEGVYTWKKGKLVKVLNTWIWPKHNYQNPTTYLPSLATISHSGVQSIKVSGNKVKIKFRNMTTIAGSMYETFTFKYKSGKLKRTSSTTTNVSIAYPSTKTLTAATWFYIYDNSDCSGNSTNTVYSNETVFLKAMRLCPKNDFIAVKVTTASGKTGWIGWRTFDYKSAQSLHNGTLFLETGMAG